MIFARLTFSVAYSVVGIYAAQNTFELPEGLAAEKLSIRVRDADAVVQTSEDFPPVFTVPEQTEQEAQRGFQSFVYVTPITAFRFRGNEIGKVSRISFVAYG